MCRISIGILGVCALPLPARRSSLDSLTSRRPSCLVIPSHLSRHDVPIFFFFFLLKLRVWTDGLYLGSAQASSAHHKSYRLHDVQPPPLDEDERLLSRIGTRRASLKEVRRDLPHVSWDVSLSLILFAVRFVSLYDRYEKKK